MSHQLIMVDVRQGDIEQSVPIGEFKRLLLAQIGSVTFTMTRKQFERQVGTAIDTVIQRIRDERVKP